MIRDVSKHTKHALCLLLKSFAIQPYKRHRMAHFFHSRNFVYLTFVNAACYKHCFYPFAETALVTSTSARCTTPALHAYGIQYKRKFDSRQYRPRAAGYRTLRTNKSVRDGIYNARGAPSSPQGKRVFPPPLIRTKSTRPNARTLPVQVLRISADTVCIFPCGSDSGRKNSSPAAVCREKARRLSI